MSSSLNRSNATSARGSSSTAGARPLPPRLYTSTTPRGGQPPPLPRLQIPLQLPRVQTNNLPPASGGDQAARQQSREVHQGLSIVTNSAVSAIPQPDVVATQLGQLSISPNTLTPSSSVIPRGATDDDEEEYQLSDENITVMRKLGEGSVGTVHKVEYRPKRKIMARKLMAVYPDETNHRQIMRELKLLKQCQSPYIVKYYGAYFSEDDDG
ncbi:MAP kinase kinase (MEK), partial [Coemansia sp. RSA 2322]